MCQNTVTQLLLLNVYCSLIHCLCLLASHSKSDLQTLHAIYATKRVRFIMIVTFSTANTLDITYRPIPFRGVPLSFSLSKSTNLEISSCKQITQIQLAIGN